MFSKVRNPSSQCSVLHPDQFLTGKLSNCERRRVFLLNGRGKLGKTFLALSEIQFFVLSWYAESPCQLQGNAIAKSVLVAWRTIQLATRAMWSRYGFMMMNKSNALRLYDETREDFYGFTVNNKNHLSHSCGVKSLIALKLRLFHICISCTPRGYHTTVQRFSRVLVI